MFASDIFDVRPRRPIQSTTWAIGGLVVGLLTMNCAPAAAAPTSYDLGDAPVRFDKGDGGPARAELTGPRLGTAVTADRSKAKTGFSVRASNAS